MKFYLLFLQILILQISCFSQDTTNLVPNWSFEINTSCPSNPSFEDFVVDWFDPYTGAQFTTTQETHGIGSFNIQIPDAINTTEFNDLVFLVRPNNSTFYTPGNSSDGSEIFVLSNDTLEQIERDVTENAAKFNIFVYPNPTSNAVKIECSENILKIEICNIMGDKILDNPVNNFYSEVILGELPKGVYILKIICKNRIYINRIIYQ